MNQFHSGTSCSVNTGVPDFDHHTRDTTTFSVIIIIIIIIDETIDHIISACPIVAKEQYIKRHDSVCAQLHFNIARKQENNWTKNTGMNMCRNR